MSIGVSEVAEEDVSIEYHDCSSSTTALTDGAQMSGEALQTGSMIHLDHAVEG